MDWRTERMGCSCWIWKTGKIYHVGKIGLVTRNPEGEDKESWSRATGWQNGSSPHESQEERGQGSAAQNSPKEQGLQLLLMVVFLHASHLGREIEGNAEMTAFAKLIATTSVLEDWPLASVAVTLPGSASGVALGLNLSSGTGAKLGSLCGVHSFSSLPVWLKS